MKSLPIGIATARKNLSTVVAQARGGQRVKLTRHGKSVAWVVGTADREVLRTTAVKPKRKRRARS